ncbi:phosphoribosyltransferase [Sulfodiicoccus acidiphilus]|uniref:Phosphoribosyltransferase n=1 Tax=Sulfodiicoccus acidiphilus TaxID=1670455 RepID=A0A348B3T0_9CREN|nr:phosphoribosyltransferase [Sulfodiicoccus acidiphilus]BBD72832.1 phosphoribosyltransferase [Sulfodiicoccus acidiphilus]GGT88644.1 phosphoribosyltransferase [Sulfodiicoccus acidiphilus]
MDKFYVPSWDDIESAVIEVGRTLLLDGFVPDVLVAIATGGLIPAKLLSDLLDVNSIREVEAKFYKSVGVTGSKPVIRSAHLDGIENRKVLVVDDVSDSGETLNAVVNLVSMFSPKAVKTATLYVKPWARTVPDYYHSKIDRWIVFPWDKWAVVRENPSVDVANIEKFKQINELLRSLHKKESG